MAAVFIAVSPHSTAVMSSHRVPLADVPNATNSPYRGVVQAVKRPRSNSITQRDLPYVNAPPAKRQMLDLEPEVMRSPSRTRSMQVEGHVFNDLTRNLRLTEFDRRLVAVREKPSQARNVKMVKTEQADNENLDSVRVWQRHYRKVFPQFVFYFESTPEDIRAKCSKQIISLGAREEKFFSKDVTHVVTTRPIPVESEHSHHNDNVQASGTNAQSALQFRTINPSLLEKSSSQQFIPSGTARPKFTFESTLAKKPPQFSGRMEGAFLRDGATIARQHNGQGDVLYRAREMGMKIWALEKLQRMMTTLLEADPGYQNQHPHNIRGNHGVSGLGKGPRDVNLSQLLRNERLNGPSDRDPTVSSKDIIPFKGPYVYIWAIDEKTKPVMFREYEKVTNRDEGAWPQFRSVSAGKCPFVEEFVTIKKEQKEPKENPEDKYQLERQKRETSVSSKSRLLVKREGQSVREGDERKPPKVLMEIENGANRAVISNTKIPLRTSFEPPTLIPVKSGSPQKHSRTSSYTYPSFGRPGRTYSGEPVASGVQPSNLTSAIRSQMISSTAAAPGVKAGTSKEVYELKRKVLERNSGPSTNGGISSSHRMTDIAGASRQDAAPVGTRVSKRRAQEMQCIEEDDTVSEPEDHLRQTGLKRSAMTLRRKVTKKDPKPGYCENCRDKFDDFDTHIESRKHRKFAVAPENWKELDDLLAKLSRPLKVQ